MRVEQRASLLVQCASQLCLISGPGHGWTGARTLGGLAVAAVALAAFAAWQHRNPEPMLDLRLLARPGFSGAAIVIALFAFALAGTLLALTQFLQLVLAYGPLKAGLALLQVAVAAAFGNGAGAALDAPLLAAFVLRRSVPGAPPVAQAAPSAEPAKSD
ncbi:hypothetical protein [Actinomadura rugatobispora]|uniref:Uncharacterized protein n=1 Tax=Actinomadura rugatobispora TaxID=1994 RepID=A0ABW1AJP2_9ACTN|nr:hypothetical protein GCM10010200_046220 [Actinomadura rugatobispora]